MKRFIIGFLGTGAILLGLLLTYIVYSTITMGTDLQNASGLLTLGLAFLLPAYTFLGTFGGLLWMWRSPGGRFTGTIEHASREQGNNFECWLYGKVRIGNREAGTAVLSKKADKLWQDTMRNGQEIEVLKMGRAIVAIRSPQGSLNDWNFTTMRYAYPLTCHLMLFALILGGLGLVWLIPVYLWGTIRSSQVLKATKPLNAGWATARY